MKRVLKIFAVISSFFILAFSSFYALDKYYESKIKYCDELGEVLSSDKDKGLYIQSKILDKEDTVSIFGSSELSSTNITSHPTNFFANKREGFQVNLVGRGYSQSIIHGIDFMALGDKLRGKKIVCILSPQWFTTEGLTSDGFEKNFSELQFYKLINNKDISKDIKLRTAKRISYLLKNSTEYSQVRLYTDLYKKDTVTSKFLLNILMPYYKVKEKVLDIRDKKNTCDIIKTIEKPKNITSSKIKNIDWDKEMKKVTDEAEKVTTNNEFGILNDYFDTYIKDKYTNMRGAYKNMSYSQSPEYEDLKIVLDFLKELDAKPLFVSVPVNGKWYDYAEFEASKRRIYYEKVNTLVSSYDFQVLDLSQYEYEKYFLKDVMHLGWKGWIYIDEGINRYFNENK